MDIHRQPDHYFAEIPETTLAMSGAATAFLDSLEPSQRHKCQYEMDSDERFRWDYRPVPRAGLPLAEMDSAQQRRALALLASGLSREGNITALNIMSLEKILGTMEGSHSNHNRDPELYFVTIFGTPGSASSWGWRLEGHHLSVNFVIAGNRISCCPQFFGANPARVPTHPFKDFATLPREEEVARRFLNALNQDQRDHAIVSDTAPPDIITGWASHIRLDDPVGLAVTELTEEQRKVMRELIDVYLGRMAPQIADAEIEQIDREGIGAIHFAWAGSNTSGEPHYYRLHGPSIVVEYDNVQNNANHIHSVWRNLRRDWGNDLLRNHYSHAHSS